MTALVLERSGDKRTAAEMIRSLKQNAVVKPDYGMYWKSISDTRGYYWHQSPIEAQALLIEAFTEIGEGADAVDDLRYWLLRQKQTRRWPTSRATAAACHALLLRGSDWMGEGQSVHITLGGISIQADDAELQAGTGYFKKTIPGSELRPLLGDIGLSVSADGKNPAARGGWGAVYWQYFQDMEHVRDAGEPLKVEKRLFIDWQYFQDMEHVRDAGEPLKVEKRLFIERSSREGPKLEPVEAGKALSVGDKLVVRLTIRSDRDLEYVHLKDLRAACMEPANVLSGYKYQGGLGYYESTRDASAQFFFSRLPRGTYVFDYRVFVAQAGFYNSGICTLECLYAPEFGSHAGGQPIEVAPGR
jgi:hypothetical protein